MYCNTLNLRVFLSTTILFDHDLSLFHDFPPTDPQDPSLNSKLGCIHSIDTSLSPRYHPRRPSVPENPRIHQISVKFQTTCSHLILRYIVEKSGTTWNPSTRPEYSRFDGGTGAAILINCGPVDYEGGHRLTRILLHYIIWYASFL
jgi:hypothetical protein